MTYTYTTPARMRQIVRDLYHSETGLRSLKAAQWLDENCTNAHLQEVFDLKTLPAAASLRGRLKAQVAKHAAWIAQQEQLAAVKGE